MNPPAWEDLPKSSRNALQRVFRLLGEGFTGQITIDCGQGGVSNVKESRNFDPRKEVET